MNNFDNIEVYSGLSWAQTLEGAQLLGTDLTYTYDHGEGATPIWGFPGTVLGVGTCLDPTSWDSYTYDVIILDTDFIIRTYQSTSVYDEAGLKVLLPSDGPEYSCQFALFNSTDGGNTFKLVKTTDIIDIDNCNYAWKLVLVGTHTPK